MLRQLDDLTVLEFSHTIMGPCAGLLLADLGAQVIKIEPAPDGDHTRQLPGFAAGFFATFNRNKRSIALNLKTDAGRDILYQLVDTADIIIENYGPGTMERLGCGWDTLSARNPRLIYLALKGFLSGPWENRPALDEVVQFQSGLAYMTGHPGKPVRAGASIIDILGAVFGITGVLTALRERDKTGQGQRVCSALFESATFLMATHMAAAATTGEAVPPMPARRGAWGVYDVFDTVDDQQLFIGVTSDAQWQRFCPVFDLTQLHDDERLSTNAQRSSERDWLIPTIGERVRQLTYAEVTERCKRAEISWSPVGRPEDLFTNEQLLHHEGLLSTLLATAQDSSAEETLLPALPLEFGDNRTRTSLRRQPPHIGEHSCEVLRSIGLNDAAIDALTSEGIVRC